MFHGFFLGILGGIVAAKLASRCRRGGGCGDGSSGWSFRGRHGCGGSYGPGSGFGPGFGRFGFFRLVHELHLSPEQWQQGRDILFELRQSLREGRDDLRGSLGPLLSILASGEFDAARAEEVAKQHDVSFGRVRKNAIVALERLHRLLTPEQRERLRRFVAETQQDR
jgi:Spy/CpxP family protein refolding chaperone